jgi:hypothetical protein
MRRSRTVTGLLLVVLIPGSFAAVANADPSDRAGDRVVSIPGAHRGEKFSGAIDTSKRAAVDRAYRSRMAANLATPIRWSGNNKVCTAGRPSGKAQMATLESLNFVRAMAGLAPITFKQRLSARAQKAALIMSANQSLSHDPPRSWRCWTRTGADAAGHSNLAIAWPRITAGGLVRQYMDDMGAGNTSCGHRRWILYPPAAGMGSGTTSTANALWVFGPTRESRPNPSWVSWPTAGWFPEPLEPHGRWSLSAGNDSTDFSHATVTVDEMGGARLDLDIAPVVQGYGKNTLVWDVSGLDPSGSYDVTVRGIRQSGRSGAFTHRYAVRLFTPSGS